MKPRSSTSAFQAYFDASLFSFLHKSLMDVRVLIFVIDLRTARRLDCQRLHQVFNLVSKAPWLQGEIASRFLAWIEVLVKPFGRRYKQATGTPIDPRARPSLLPHERVPFARKYENVSARSMPMSSWIRPYQVFFDVGAYGVGRKMQQDSPRSLPASAVLLQSKSRNIGDEIGIPGPVIFDFSSLAAEVSLFTAESIRETKGIVENELEVAKAVNHHRRVRQRQKPCRFIALRVEMLPPGIERRRKHTPFLPFEGLLASLFIPNTGCSASFDDIDELFEKIMLGLSFTLGGDFTDVGITTAPGAQHVDESPRRALALPGAEGDRFQILDPQTVIHRDLFRLLP